MIKCHFMSLPSVQPAVPPLAPVVAAACSRKMGRLQHADAVLVEHRAVDLYPASPCTCYRPAGSCPASWRHQGRRTAGSADASISMQYACCRSAASCQTCLFEDVDLPAAPTRQRHEERKLISRVSNPLACCRSAASSPCPTYAFVAPPRMPPAFSVDAPAARGTQADRV
jgi:hypothetical protein